MTGRTPPRSETNQILSNRKNKGGLERTPPPLFNQNSLQTSTMEANQRLKRRAEEELVESSHDMLYDKLMNKFNTLSDEIKSMEAHVERKIDERFDGLQIFIDKTEKRLENVEVKVDVNATRLEQNTKAINYLNQKELENKIDIIGAQWPESIEKERIKEEVLKVMIKYNIDLDISKIKTAYLKNIKQLNIKIMVVEFNDFETKLKVLKEKRQSKIRDGIFFDNSLTPMNGKLMSSARKIAKEKKFKVYLNYNRICVKKSNGNIKWIESEADLEIVSSWNPNSSPKTQQNVRVKPTSTVSSDQNPSA